MKFIKWVMRRLRLAKPDTETLIWVGDGMTPNGYAQVGREINLDGRHGRVVSGDLLTITVQWD